MKLVAVQQEGGGLVWRPAEPGAPAAPTADELARDEEAWLREKQTEIERQRVADARKAAAQKKAESAALFAKVAGGPGRGGGGRGRGAAIVRVAESRALLDLRAELSLIHI